VETNALSVVFSSSVSLKQLAIIIDRATYIGTCELLLQPSEISLKRPLEASGLSTTVVGAILERQIEGLEGSLWKESVQKVVKALLADASGAYPQGDMPVRRARILILCLEFGYRAGDGVSRHPDDIGEETEELLGRNVCQVFFCLGWFWFLISVDFYTESWSRWKLGAVLSAVLRDITFLVGFACSSTRRCAADVTCCTSL